MVEGTTMMFEFPPTKAGASLGTVNHGRLDEFDKIYGRKDEHRRLSPQQLKTFILDNSVFLRGGGSTYSLGWALVYYCWKEKRTSGSSAEKSSIRTWNLRNSFEILSH